MWDRGLVERLLVNRVTLWLSWPCRRLVCLLASHKPVEVYSRVCRRCGAVRAR